MLGAQVVPALGAADAAQVEAKGLGQEPKRAPRGGVVGVQRARVAVLACGAGGGGAVLCVGRGVWRAAGATDRPHRCAPAHAACNQPPPSAAPFRSPPRGPHAPASACMPGQKAPSDDTHTRAMRPLCMFTSTRNDARRGPPAGAGRLMWPIAAT